MTQPTPASFREDPKQAAVDQWTADPCGPDSKSPPGTRPYFEDLLEGRRAYAAWMDSALDYDGAEGLRVLDVGCGQGIDAARYAMAGAQVTAVDLTPRHVELASQHLESVGLQADLRVADAEQLPFPDASFDRVSSNGVLHHTPDMHGALAEIRRVLRPGGETRLIVYNRNSIHYWLGQVLERGLLRGLLLKEGSMQGVLSAGVERSSIGARPLVRVYSRRQMRRLLSAAGLADVSTQVRHFKPSNSRITDRLSRLIPALRGAAAEDRLGRLAGWYVVARGVRAG